MKKKIILAVLLLSALACGKSSEVKNTTVKAPAANTETNAQPPAPPAKEEVYTSGADPRADLISAAQKRQKLPFWSAKVAVENMPQLNAEMQYSAPDRYWFKQAEGEAIVIGKETYSNETGAWVKEDENASDIIREKITSGINEGAQGLKDVSIKINIVGKEKINGQETNIYSFTSGGMMTKVWIESKSGLELKNEIETDSEETGKLKYTTIYDYVTLVKIEAPKID